MKRYLRRCLTEATLSDVDAAALTLDELLQIATMGSLEVNKSEMYQFLMQSLRISRNVLDQRMKRIHAILWELRAEEDD